jgi:hypothetical protein
MVSQEFLAMAYDAPVVKWAPVNRSVRIASAIALVACASVAVLAQRDQPAAAGEALFERSCASCRNVEGRAPSLSTGVFTHGGDEAQLARSDPRRLRTGGDVGRGEDGKDRRRLRPELPRSRRLRSEGRDFICFEPMAGITDALNLAQRGLYRDVQYIAPGGFWKETFWIRPSGF